MTTPTHTHTLSQAAAEFTHLGGGRELGGIKFLAQERSRPPTFAVSVAAGTDFGDTPRRQLANMIRRRWGLDGVPVRVVVRRRTRRPAAGG